MLGTDFVAQIFRQAVLRIFGQVERVVPDASFAFKRLHQGLGHQPARLFPGHLPVSVDIVHEQHVPSRISEKPLPGGGPIRSARMAELRVWRLLGKSARQNHGNGPRTALSLDDNCKIKYKTVQNE